MLRLQIKWERSGANHVRCAHSQSSTSQELKPGCQLMPLPEIFQDTSFICHLYSVVSLGIHPGHYSLSPSGWGDSASSADPTFGYRLQTRIADAVSGISNTTNTQHGLTALAVGFPSPEAVSDPSSPPFSGGGRLAARQMVLLLQLRPPLRTDGPARQRFGNGTRTPPRTRQWVL